MPTKKKPSRKPAPKRTPGGTDVSYSVSKAKPTKIESSRTIQPVSKEPPAEKPEVKRKPAKRFYKFLRLTASGRLWCGACGKTYPTIEEGGTWVEALTCPKNHDNDSLNQEIDGESSVPDNE